MTTSQLPTNPDSQASRFGRQTPVDLPRTVTVQVDRLCFEQGWIEAEFLAKFRSNTLSGLRRTMKVVLVLQLAWSLVDWQVAPASLYLLWPLRYGLVCPILLGFLWISGFERFDRYRDQTLWFVSIVLCLSAIAITMLTGPDGHLYYFPGLILCTFGCGTSPGHRFRTSTCLNLAMFVAYELAINLFGHATQRQIMTNSMWLIWANLAAMSTSYAIERQLRFDYWQKRIIRDQSEELQRVIRKVEESRKEVERISRIDPLTGLYNRRHFFGEARRGEGRIAVVILDVDHFKAINDRFGHSTGDRILKELADRIKASIRPNDVACRYGGEEFAILLPDADMRAAALIAERLRQTAEASPFDAQTRPQAVTISVGVAAVDDRQGGIEDLIDRADKALYEAKNAGRNRIKISLGDPKSSLGKRKVVR